MNVVTKKSPIVYFDIPLIEISHHGGEECDLGISPVSTNSNLNLLTGAINGKKNFEIQPYVFTPDAKLAEERWEKHRNSLMRLYPWSRAYSGLEGLIKVDGEGRSKDEILQVIYDNFSYVDNAIMAIGAVGTGYAIDKAISDPINLDIFTVLGGVFGVSFLGNSFFNMARSILVDVKNIPKNRSMDRAKKKLMKYDLQIASQTPIFYEVASAREIVNELESLSPEMRKSIDTFQVSELLRERFQKDSRYIN